VDKILESLKNWKCKTSRMMKQRECEASTCFVVYSTSLRLKRTTKLAAQSLPIIPRNKQRHGRRKMKLKQRSCTVNSCTLVIGIPFDGCVVHQPGSSTSPSSGTIVEQSVGTRPIETSDPDFIFHRGRCFISRSNYICHN
jgi:hypothetical protein